MQFSIKIEAGTQLNGQLPQRQREDMTPVFQPLKFIDRLLLNVIYLATVTLSLAHLWMATDPSFCA